MGTVEQTPHRGSHRTSRREKEGQGTGVSVGRWAKETLRPRKGIERNTEKRGTTIDIRGTAQVETDPHTGNRTEKRRRSRRQIRAQGTKTISGERKATNAKE